ncbi:UNVERIFIED_CONTAM: hypothetical protein Sangu_2561600 [Sesamum angustifolium]|uniref:DUF7722 domain-containing protein n=1 Tax=Sesamum angustifolium TaxID=2727405 RepID=A0AAW2J943_9LAMI
MSTGAAASAACATVNGGVGPKGHQHHRQQASSVMNTKGYGFQMPLHYPRYKKSDYEKMPEWQLDCLLKEYGLPVAGDVHQKRKFAIGAFLWPDQL